MKAANDVARHFIVGEGRAHLCSSSRCDCVAELARVIDQARTEGANQERWRARQLRLAKPRIAEALEETRTRLRKRA